MEGGQGTTEIVNERGCENIGRMGGWRQMRACRVEREEEKREKEEYQKGGDEGCRKQRKNCGKSWRTEEECQERRSQEVEEEKGGISFSVGEK